MKIDGQKEMKEFLLRIKGSVEQAEEESLRELSPNFIDSKKKNNNVIIELEFSDDKTEIKVHN